MAAALLLTGALLLAAGGPAGARGPVPAGLTPGRTLQRSGDPRHGPAWGQRWPGLSPAWEASGEPSGAGAPGGERWGGSSPVRWFPSLRAGEAVGAPPETETSTEVAEEMLIAGQGHEAKGWNSPQGGTSLPHGSALGAPGPEVPVDTGLGSSGPPWAGHSTPSPRPTVSTIAMTPVPAAGMSNGVGTDAHRGGQSVAEGPTAAMGTLVPLGTGLVSHPKGTSAHTSPGSTQPLGTQGDLGGPPVPSLAPLSSASRLPPAAPSLGLAEPWTRAFPSHQRSTRRAPLSLSTAGTGDAAPRTDPGPMEPQPAPGAALSTGPALLLPNSSITTDPPGTGLLPEEDVGTPQRVRGAVGAVSIPNATEAAPQPTAPPTAGTNSTRRSGFPGTNPPAHGSASPSVTAWRAAVTPQPAPRHPSTPYPPQPPQPPQTPQPSHPSPSPGSNGTGLRWAELRRQLGFTWETHIYGAAATFLLLALGCVVGLAWAAALRPLNLPHILGAHGLLLCACLLRAAFLLLDPYGARHRLPPRALLLLSTVPFPMMLGAFALLLQRLQRLAQLRLLPPWLRGLPALGAAAALQSAVLGAADLLPPRLGPALGLGLQGLGCGAGALLLLGGLCGCWRLLRAPPEDAGRGARALLAAAVAGLPVCGLQLYSALWLRGVLGAPARFSRPGWAAQLWLRAAELGTALALLVAATEPLCCRCRRRRSPAAHSCWAKALRFFCAGRKAEAPEYPNNCYDWAGGGTERGAGNDISKSLIRNPAGQLPLRALKDSSEPWAGSAAGPGLSPKCPNLAAARSCAAFEQGSSPSLGELAFRPPSPIDLRRSIDQALCRRHLLHDGLFGRPRRGSGPSLRGSPTPAGTPGLGRMVRCSSLTELPGPRHPAGTATITVTASTSSLDSSSLKISWNPWRHGLSSPDSLPVDEAPSRAPLLLPPTGTPGCERDGPRGSPAIAKAMDSRSLSSDTIEL
ncbi:proline-rich transmembrane protein 3 [Neopsephotus bourkii]|uniref:proline-rich transmembrane protein 3 n=1 Tax=Neopsephotus bourkii TaxID=309878 RepID=UPI002AA54931|nr:proline-rich transmembrane protein 3 [Neopsephotus bourkii]